MRILLAEDSERLRALLSHAIRQAGYGIDVAGTAADLLAAYSVAPFDLVIVDLGLPDGDGLDAIRDMRRAGAAVPILIVTARDAVEDRIRGLDSGADDYLTKPFNNGELLARIRALLRRPPAMAAGSVIKAGPIELDEATGTTTVLGRPIELRASERRLLALLARRSDLVVGKSAIEAALSEFGKEISANAVEVLVSRLRKAIAQAAPGALHIETVRGIGYALRLNAEHR